MFRRLGMYFAPDGGAGSSTAAVVDPATEEKPTGDPIEAPLPEGTKQETADRFKQLLDDRKSKADRLAAYEQHGSPEEIAALKQKVTQLDAVNARIEQLESERGHGEPKSDEQKKLETLRTKAREELRAIDGGIAEGERAAHTLDGMLSGLEEDAMSATVDVLKEHGIATTEDTVGRWARRCAVTIQETPKLKRLYFRDPEAAVRKAFELEVAEAGSIAERKTKAAQQKDKEKLTGLPKPHGGGGGPSGASTPGPAKTAAEGVERAMARLGELRK